MNKTAITILNDYGVMALATVRPDGWPQATCVSYVNDGLLIYFLVSRSSQKFKNILKDDRVSIAIGADRASPTEIEGLSIAAHAFELRDEPYRSAILKRLSLREGTGRLARLGADPRGARHHLRRRLLTRAGPRGDHHGRRRPDGRDDRRAGEQLGTQSHSLSSPVPCGPRLIEPDTAEVRL